MRPSADVGQSTGERRAGGFIFPDREDSRPSPNIPRDGNPRSVRNEQSEQQRILIDWDAAPGLHDSDEFAYSACIWIFQVVVHEVWNRIGVSMRT